VILTKTIMLNPGQNQAVSFQVTPQEAGTYSVVVDGLRGSFLAIEAAPPEPKGREFINISITYHCIAGFKPTQVKGKFALVSLSQTKPGLAGIEQDIVTRADGDYYFLEATNWYYDNDIYKVGMVGYRGSTPVLNKKASSILGQVYSYLIAVEPNGIRGQVWDEAGNLLVNGFIPCVADYLREITTFIEYWRYYSEVIPGAPIADQWVWLPGKFEQKSYHIIEELYDPNIGWKTARECLKENYEKHIWNSHPYALNILHIHHTLHGNYYYDECEVIDAI